ncbi:uncharacterized protein TNCV_3577941 [Trichonephila clavipes]|uniref:Uncharacterized protein n=1 Tax=Trichonephila clavipes TaxID=2585209 RepID=A0A8X6V3M5_TRICX|nr:uncharacterized protein TNCV_3577941 [Trichonephila clavipes]
MCRKDIGGHVITRKVNQNPGYSRVKFTCRNCGGGDRGRVAIYRPFGEVSLSLNRTVTCMVLKANDRRTSCPCHDEFRGPRSDYVRQVALATTTTTKLLLPINFTLLRDQQVPTGWRSWFVTGHLHLKLRVQPQPMSVDFHDGENRQRS